MYYVIEYYYTGNSGQCIDGDRIVISTAPVVNPYPGDELFSDDFFEIPDYLVTTYAEYATIKDARDAIFNFFGPVREVEPEYPDENVIETYKYG